MILQLRSLLRHPRAKRPDVVAFQNERLRRLVAHAYHRVPYYRGLFERHGIKPEDIGTIADLARIPITDKRDLQALAVEESFERGVDAARLVTHRTSGSSGEPLTIRRTWLEERLLGAFRLRAMHQLGLRPWDRRVRIVRMRPPDPTNDRLSQRALRAMGLYRHAAVDCALSTEQLVSALRDLRPDVLVGFPGVLSEIAAVLSDDDRRAIRLRFIALGGEVATPLMRRQISEGFRAPLFEVYACYEVGLVAWQCRETGALHVCDDAVCWRCLRTVDRGGGRARRGRGDGLALFAMPFIRYRLGDLVTRGVDACPCGQPFAVIGAVQGRMIDYFPLPDGRNLHPYEIVSAVVDSLWIRQYRLLQERVDRIVLEVVPATTPSAADVALLEDRIGKLVGREVAVVVTLVPEIALEPGGKFRVSRSRVQSRYDEIDRDQGR